MLQVEYIQATYYIKWILWNKVKDTIKPFSPLKVKSLFNYFFF